MAESCKAKVAVASSASHRGGGTGIWFGAATAVHGSVFFLFERELETPIYWMQFTGEPHHTSDQPGQQTQLAQQTKIFPWPVEDAIHNIDPQYSTGTSLLAEKKRRRGAGNPLAESDKGR